MNNLLRPYNLQTVDLNMDSMNTFMKDIVQQVNQQGDHINQLLKEIKRKPDHDQIGEKFKQISEALDFNDSEIRKKMELKFVNKQKIDGDILNESVNKTCERLQLLSKGWEYSLDLNKSYTQKVNKLEQGLDSKVDKTYVKRKTRKARNIAHSELDDARKKILQRINDFEKESKREDVRIEYQIKESEKKTYWKIQDCEKLLQKRVNEEFVEQAIRNLDNKMTRQMTIVVDKSYQDKSDEINYNKKRIMELDNVMNDKIKLVKRLINQQEEQNKKMYMQQSMYDDHKLIQNTNIQEASRKIQEIEKKGDYRDGQIKLLDIIKQIESDQSETGNNVMKLKMSFDEFVSNYLKSETVKQQNTVDIHRVCGIESDVKVADDNINELKHAIKKMDTEVEIKQQAVVDKINQQIKKMNNKEDDKIKLKEQFIDIVEKNNNKMLTEITNLRKKINEVEDNSLSFDLEKKMNNLEQKINVDEILGILNNKITQKDLNMGMGAVDKDIQQIQNILQNQQNQLSTFNKFMLDFQQSVEDMSQKEEVVSAFVKNNRITKLRCGTCGIQNAQFYSKESMRGTDGKYYKSDLKGINLKEGQEVYDLTLNQASKLFKADKESRINASQLNDSIYKK